MIDDQLGMRILDELNDIARQTNAAYDGVNSRSVSEGQLRARLTTMREHIGNIETHLIGNTVLASVKDAG